MSWISEWRSQSSICCSRLTLGSIDAATAAGRSYHPHRDVSLLKFQVMTVIGEESRIHCCMNENVAQCATATLSGMVITDKLRS